MHCWCWACYSPHFLGRSLALRLGSTNGTTRLLFKSISEFGSRWFIYFWLWRSGWRINAHAAVGSIPVFTNWTTYEWPNFVVLAVGVGLSVYMLVRSPRQRPLVANIAIAYGLFPPLTAAGFNLVVYHDGAWIAGITVAGVHLAFGGFGGDCHVDPAGISAPQSWRFPVDRIIDRGFGGSLYDFRVE